LQRSIAIALLCALAAAACSSRKKSLKANAVAEAEELDELIRRNVADEDRAERLRVVQAKIHRTSIEFFNDVMKAREEALRLNANYDAHSDAFASLQSLLSANRKRRAEDLIRYAMEARRIATAEEWAAMGKDRGN
jgi:hypothetical protein